MQRLQPIPRQSPGYDPADEAFEEEGVRQQEVRRERLKQLGLELLGRWHWIALGLVLGWLGSLYYLSKVPKQYRATSTLLVKQQTSSVMARDQIDEIDLRSAEALNTLAERLKRPEMLERVTALPEIRSLPGLIPEPVRWTPSWLAGRLAQAGPESDPADIPVPPAAELAGKLSQWLSISLRRNTRLLDLTVTHPSPAAAKAMADAIAVEYQAELSGKRSTGRSSSMEILVRESENTRAQLQAAQSALASYEVALLALKDLESRKATALELTRRYLPAHPRMAAASADLAAAQDRFLSEFEAAIKSPADRLHWQNAEEEWSGDAEESTRLQTARRLLLTRGTILSSEIDTRTNVFNSILTRIQESDINQQAVESEMEISSMAQLPTSPSSPDPKRMKTQGALMGGGFGVLLALLLARLDNKLHTVSQVEQETDLPLLAVIADMPLTALPAKSKGWDPRLVFRPGASHTSYAQMFRVLRTSVALLGNERHRRITLFSSALPGEGKTLICSNFALAAAQQGKRTLLIDLDLFQPSVHKIFGLKRDGHGNGVTEILAGQADFSSGIFTGTGQMNLHLMLAGRTAPNPGELLSTVALGDLLRTAAAHYDLVVLDSAPLLAVPDTRIIAPLVDNFCLVARAEHVPKAALRFAMTLLAADNNLPGGIVFNGFREKRRLFGRSRSYATYQSYHYGYGAYGPEGT